MMMSLEQLVEGIPLMLTVLLLRNDNVIGTASGGDSPHAHGTSM